MRNGFLEARRAIARKSPTRALALLAAAVVAASDLAFFMAADPGPSPVRTGHPLRTLGPEESLAMTLEFSKSAAVGAQKNLQIALYYNASSCDPPEDLRRLLDSEPRWKSVTIGPGQIATDELAVYDLVIFPGGRAARQLTDLGESGREAIRHFVGGGGGYLGICAGAFLASSRYLALVGAEVQAGQVFVPQLGERRLEVRGPAHVAVGLTPEGRRVLGDWPDPIRIDFAGGPVFLDGGMRDPPPCVALARYRSEVSDIEPQVGTMIGTPTILAASFGRGRVIAIGAHPDRSEGLGLLVKRAISAVARGRKGVEVGREVTVGPPPLER